MILFVYVFSAVCAGLTGIYLAAQFGSGQPYLGVNYTLASITPVVVGGTVLSGGPRWRHRYVDRAYLLSLLNNLINFAGIAVAVSAHRARRGSHHRGVWSMLSASG